MKANSVPMYKVHFGTPVLYIPKDKNGVDIYITFTVEVNGKRYRVEDCTNDGEVVVSADGAIFRFSPEELEVIP